MNRIMLAPGVLSFMLAVLVAFEIVGSSHTVMQGMPRPATTPVRAGPMHHTDIAADASSILARPIFSADRRPVHDRSVVQADAAAPRLSAIMISGASRQVVFDDGGKPLVAREGGRAGPYSVLSIGADRVTVASADGTRVLRPTALPTDAGNAASTTGTGVSDIDGSRPNSDGLSLLQQLQRGAPPQVGLPPPSSIQNLIARMRGAH